MSCWTRRLGGESCRIIVARNDSQPLHAVGYPETVAGVVVKAYGLREKRSGT